MSVLVKDLIGKHPEVEFELMHEIVTDLFETISKRIDAGERVRLPGGKGVFFMKTIKAKVQRNPRTGEKLNFGERRRVRFKAGKNFVTTVEKSAEPTAVPSEPVQA